MEGTPFERYRLVERLGGGGGVVLDRYGVWYADAMRQL